MAIQHASLLERKFAFLSGNFLSNCSSEFLLVTDSERPGSKASLSKTRKTSKDQKKLFLCGLQNIQGKFQKLASITLTCDFIVTRLLHERMLHLFSEKIYFTILQSSSDYL